MQTRIITLADMFDALVSSDRPYKPAMSVDAALAVLQAEADAGLLDRDLVQLMRESEIYRSILDDEAHAR
jgi:HD-GYP domain-containing protein (c-di-GMP phosphodiesterase class II)